MTPPTPTHTHIWDGSDLPDWLTGHRWHDGQLVIRTPDGDTRPQPGWWLIGWSDGTITVASPTSGERVYGAGGLCDRLARAQAELAGVRALRDRWVKAGPPPLGQQISRWWDRRLVELGGALSREQPDARPEPEDLTGAYTPDPPIGCLTPDGEAHLAQDGIDTPGCDCGHHGMGASWHSDDCPWRSGVVDCPGRPTPG